MNLVHVSMVHRGLDSVFSHEAYRALRYASLTLSSSIVSQGLPYDQSESPMSRPTLQVVNLEDPPEMGVGTGMSFSTVYDH
jgi:hypothetical protein